MCHKVGPDGKIIQSTKLQKIEILVGNVQDFCHLLLARSMKQTKGTIFTTRNCEENSNRRWDSTSRLIDYESPGLTTRL